jgi:predicted regulator of Ras-like GTPase activity (Roadblock/LC7/MglB family)
MTEAHTALAELTEISSQVEAAVLFDRSGAVTEATLPDVAAARLASSARALLESAEQLRDGELTQIEAATSDGSLFIARDGERLIAAVTRPEPTAGLVFYDLKSCLRRVAEKPKPKPKRRSRAKASGTT